MPNADLVYNADLSNDPVVVENSHRGCHGVYWMPPPPPPDYPNVPPTLPEGIKPPPPPPPVPYPWVYPYPYNPPFFPPPPPVPKPDDPGEEDNPSQDDPKPPSQDEI